MATPYIYKVTNKINGRVYIGQHDGTKPNYFASGRLINRAIKKYGKEAFEREIIISGSFSQQELDELEILHIKLCKSYFHDYPKSGYNLTRGGGGKRGWVPTNDCRARMSKNSAMQKSVVQFDLNGNEIARYRTTLEAAAATNSHSSSIVRACNKKAFTAAECMWLYADDVNAGEKPVLRLSKIFRSICQYTKKGELINIYNNIEIAARANSLKSAAIRNCLVGYSQSSGGYKWAYS